MAVYTAMHNHSRQINTQIFLAYSDRLQGIRRSMRSDLISTRSAGSDAAEAPEIPLGAIEALHLIFELFQLRAQGYVRTSQWNVWCRDIDRFLNAPKIRSGREQIRREFEGHNHFIEWMERRQDEIAARTVSASHGPGRLH